jgi:hypothetical protein
VQVELPLMVLLYFLLVFFSELYYQFVCVCVNIFLFL